MKTTGVYELLGQPSYMIKYVLLDLFIHIFVSYLFIYW